MKKFTFNFSFHPVNGVANDDANAGQLLYCEGIPFTLGLYFPATAGGFYRCSYVFKPGEGTTSEMDEKTVLDTEEDVQKYLIQRAVGLILKFHADKPEKVAAGVIC